MSGHPEIHNITCIIESFLIRWEKYQNEIVKPFMKVQTHT